MNLRTLLSFRSLVLSASILSASGLAGYEQGTYLIFRVISSSEEPVETGRIAVDASVFQAAESDFSASGLLNLETSKSSFLIEMDTLGTSQSDPSEAGFQDFGGRQSSSFLGESNEFEQNNSIGSPFGRQN